MSSLSHYTSAINAINIITSQHFIFGHLEHSNDPFENLKKRYLVSYNIPDSLRLYMDQIFEFVNNKISFASFGLSDNLIPDGQNWPMWSHYGNLHSGVCLIFDLESTISEINKLTDMVIAGNIKYTNFLLINPIHFEERICIPTKDLLIELQDFLLLSKHKAWEYENELRIIVFHDIFKIPIKNCLKKVLYGPEIKPKNLSRIENILKEIKFKGPHGKLNYALGSYAKPLSFIFNDIN